MSSADDQEFLKQLEPMHRRFAEAIVAGLTGTESARAAGHPGETKNALSCAATRMAKRPDVQRAIRILRVMHFGDGFPILEHAERTLRELLDDRTSPQARARATEIVYKLSGRLGPQKSRPPGGDGLAMEIARQSSPAERAWIMITAIRRWIGSVPEDLKRSALEFMSGESDDLSSRDMDEYYRADPEHPA